jgi:protein subunit release factor B
MARDKVLSVTMADCDLDHFRSGGKGGQNQNKRDTGTRITHRASGAVGESREHRTQLQNKQTAFRRMTESPKFQTWIKRELGGLAKVEAEVQAEMAKSQNIRVEIKDGGRWVIDNSEGETE